MRHYGMALGLAVGLLAAACDGDARQLREWTPEDHQQPTEPDPTRTPATDEPPEATMARAAATLYAQRCGACHGVDGRGGSAAPGGAAMPDLSAASFHDARTDAELTQVISAGRGMMPAFGQELNERGIAALVAHVRTLRASPAP